MNIEMRDIEYFAVVAERAHVGRAAEELGLSQSALSKSLRRLEHALNAKLVRRTPKGPIKALDIREWSWRRTVAITYRKEAYLPPAAQRLIDALKTTASRLQNGG